MLLNLHDGRSFAQGVCKYQYRPVTPGETTPRIVVQVKIDNLDAQAVVDTGGAYLVCDPQIAAALDLDATDALETVSEAIAQGDRHFVFGITKMRAYIKQCLSNNG